MKNFQIEAQTLLGETDNFGFCSLKIGLFRGVGGSPKFFFHWNVHIFVSMEPKQKLESYDTPLCQFSNGGKKRRRKEKYQK